jgi:hypothetical protein
MIVAIDSAQLNIYIILQYGFDDDGHQKAIEASRPHGGACRQGNLVLYCAPRPRQPAYRQAGRAGLAGHVPVTLTEKGGSRHAHV